MTRLEVMLEQNRLLLEQNDLLRELRNAQGQIGGTPEPSDPAPAGMMTDRDMLMITMAEDVLQAVTKWNTYCRTRKGESICVG